MMSAAKWRRPLLGSPLERKRKRRPRLTVAAMLVLFVSTYLLFLVTSTLFFPRPTTSALSSSSSSSSTSTSTSTTPGKTTTITTSAKTPLLPINFPDPCIIQDPSTGAWYAFATGSLSPPSNSTDAPTFKNIQVATAPSPAGPWTYLDSADPLPHPGPWTLGPGSQTWAPSVHRLPSSPSTTTNSSSDGDGGPEGWTYVMYYSGQVASRPGLHCVGAARSTTGHVLGPYEALAEPVACPLAGGGAIDPAGFADPASGRRYLLYKVDGNALGSGGECNNGVPPRRATPIVLHEVDRRDGVSLVAGEGTVILDRTDADGPLVEAPELVYVPPPPSSSGPDGAGGRYVLFYSNHCWDAPGYSVNYAVAADVRGPYRRAEGGPLIRTGDGFNVTAPGGAAPVPGARWVLFHGHCPAGRCLFGAQMEVVGERVIVS